MSVLISSATGNFTASGTWSLVDTTSYLDSEAGSTASTTSYVYSSTFTPGALTVDGVAVKIAALAFSPTGTFSVELFNNTDLVSVASVTINCSDIANSGAAVTATYNRGWYFLKFSSSQLLVAGKAYKIGIKTSTAGQVNIYRDATAGNWSRMIRLPLGQAPAAGDQLHIIGEWTAAATLTSFTVTMENTATTSFGPTVSGGPPQGITIGKGGTLTNAIASANHYLRWKGIFRTCDGGTLNIGTSGSVISSSQTATYEMDSVAIADTGFEFGHGSTVNIYGYGRVQSNWKQFLTSNAAAAATTLLVTSTAGWAAGDELAIASTTQTPSQCEKRTILTVDSSTQVTLTAALTNAHSGTSPTQAEVINLTRNLKIRGIGTNAPSISTTLTGYVSVEATAVVNIQNAEFYYLGSASAPKRGIEAATTTGTFNMQYCGFHDGWLTNTLGLYITTTSGSGVTVSNNAFWNTGFYGIGIASATTGVLVFDNNVLMLNTAGISTADAGSTFTNNTIVGCSQYGILIGELIFASGINSGNTVHSCGGTGFQVGSSRLSTVTNLTIWRCAGGGVFLPYSGGIQSTANFTFDTLVAFGNSTYNIGFGSYPTANVLLINPALNGDSTFPTANGIQLGNYSGSDIIIEGGDLGTAAGIKVAHSTADINISTSTNNLCKIVTRNSKMGSSVQVANIANALAGSYVTAQRLGTTAGNHKSWLVNGVISIDTTLFKTASPSARLTPSSASLKLQSCIANFQSGFCKQVASGATVTASVWVRRSKVASGDAATYNGNLPRLMVRRNVAAGISADTVLATATVASDGAWELISGTTAAVTDDSVLDFFVDCDGTVGWVNIDDFS